MLAQMYITLVEHLTAKETNIFPGSWYKSDEKKHHG